MHAQLFTAPPSPPCTHRRLIISRYFDFTCTTRPDESFTKYAPHCRQSGTRLTMPTTTQPTKQSAASSVWTHSRGTATGEQPGGHNGWPSGLALTWTDWEFTLSYLKSTLTAATSTLCWTRHRDSHTPASNALTTPFALTFGQY